MRATAAGLLASALIVVSAIGASAAEAPGQEGGIGLAATTITVTDSLARVEAEAFDGQGTHHNRFRETPDFVVFDRSVRVDDTDDRPRGAFGSAAQLATIAELDHTITMKSTGSGFARQYDRNLGDSLQPAGHGLAAFSATIEVVGGSAAWSLRGRLEAGDNSEQSFNCGQVELVAPDATPIRANPDCDQALDVTEFDIGGTLGPGTGSIQLTGLAEAMSNGESASRATFEYDLTLTVSACTIGGTPDADIIQGTANDDVICGGDGNDLITGLAGDDTIYAGPGDDEVLAGSGDDLVFGAEGVDRIDGSVDRDIVFGGPGEDVIFDRRGPNALLSGDGDDDLVCGSHQRDTMRGGDGRDVLLGLGGSDDLDGGSGNDDLLGDGNAGQAVLLGCDEPFGSPAPTSEDTLDGGPGNDVLLGGAGADLMNGNPGDDELGGGAGGDRLTGSTGRDVLRGEGGNDRMNACDSSRDTVVGGPGSADVAKRTSIDVVRSTETRLGC